MQTIGITGSIASGKSSVERLLSRYWPVIDADQVARDVVAVNSEGLAAVVKAFGPDALMPDGSLDRARIRKRIAADPSAQKILNGIMHPRIAVGIKQRIEDYARSGHELVFVSAALMLESGSWRNYDRVILVCAPESVRLERLLARDAMDDASARQLMARQMPEQEKRGFTPWVIENDGSLAELEQATRALLVKLGWPLPDGGP